MRPSHPEPSARLRVVEASQNARQAALLSLEVIEDNKAGAMPCPRQPADAELAAPACPREVYPMTSSAGGVRMPSARHPRALARISSAAPETIAESAMLNDGGK